jgi:hypothetical protein
MSYAGVWFIVVLFGGLSASGWYMLMRTFGSAYAKILVPAIWLALVLVPAPVPEFSGHYAPAFVVLVFEGLFQSEGNAGVALRLLAAGVCLAVAAVSLVFLILRRRRQADVGQQ